jgi:hypothetical protein
MVHQGDRSQYNSSRSDVSPSIPRENANAQSASTDNMGNREKILIIFPTRRIHFFFIYMYDVGHKEDHDIANIHTGHTTVLQGEKHYKNPFHTV